MQPQVTSPVESRSGLYITTRLTRGNIIETICRFGNTNQVVPVRFCNWLYAAPQNYKQFIDAQTTIELIRKQHPTAIARVQTVKNMVFSSSPTPGATGDQILSDHACGWDAIQVFYNEPAAKFLKNAIESSGCRVYEAEVPLEWRFVTHNKLSLFQPIIYTPRESKLERLSSGTEQLREAEIPICFFLQKQPRLYFMVNIRDEVVKLRLSESPADDASIALWMCWGERDTNPDLGGVGWTGNPASYLIFLRRVVINLFDAYANKNANKQILHPHDFAVFETKCGVDLAGNQHQREVIEDLIRGFVGIAMLLPCTLDTMTRRKSKKTLADAILFSQCRPNTIVEPPETFAGFQSEAIIFKKEHFARASVEEEIWLLDFVSHYPNIILALAERCPRLSHVAATLRLLLRLKGISKGMLKTMYKLVLNAVGYGTMGIKLDKMQNLSRSMLEICAMVCQISHEITNMAHAVFAKHGATLMHSHTDSLIVRGKPAALRAAQLEVNRNLETAIPRTSYTTLELKEKIRAIIIFSANDMFYVSDDVLATPHGIGHCFNSIAIPEFSRDQILEAFKDSLTKSLSVGDVFTNYFAFQKQLRESADSDRIERRKTPIPLRLVVTYNTNASPDKQDATKLDSREAAERLRKLQKDRWERAARDGGNSSEYFACMTMDTGCTRDDMPFTTIANFGKIRGLPEYASLLTLTFVYKHFRGYMQRNARVMTTTV